MHHKHDRKIENQPDVKYGCRTLSGTGNQHSLVRKVRLLGKNKTTLLSDPDRVR